MTKNKACWFEAIVIWRLYLLQSQLLQKETSAGLKKSKQQTDIAGLKTNEGTMHINQMQMK